MILLISICTDHSRRCLHLSSTTVRALLGIDERVHACLYLGRKKSNCVMNEPSLARFHNCSLTHLRNGRRTPAARSPRCIHHETTPKGLKSEYFPLSKKLMSDAESSYFSSRQAVLFFFERPAEDFQSA
jgi:hypothetical protein